MAPQPGLEPGTNADLKRVQSVALATELLSNVYLTLLYFNYSILGEKKPA